LAHFTKLGCPEVLNLMSVYCSVLSRLSVFVTWLESAANMLPVT